MWEKEKLTEEIPLHSIWREVPYIQDRVEYPFSRWSRGTPPQPPTIQSNPTSFSVRRIKTVQPRKKKEDHLLPLNIIFGFL